MCDTDCLACDLAANKCVPPSHHFWHRFFGAKEKSGPGRKPMGLFTCNCQREVRPLVVCIGKDDGHSMSVAALEGTYYGTRLNNTYGLEIEQLVSDQI